MIIITNDEQKALTLCRKALTGLDMDLKGYDEMTKVDQVNFADDLSKVFHNKSFTKLLDLIEKQQVMWIARDSQNEKQKDFSRGTINAIDLIKDNLEKYNLIHDTKPEDEEEIDKQQVI